MRAPWSPGVSLRAFASYQGQKVTSDQLLKKQDDWIIEETNFCLGRVVVRTRITADAGATSLAGW